MLEEFYSYDDFCGLCAEERKNQGLIPHIKVQLPHKTLRHNSTVSVCPNCDGEALEIALRKGE